MFKTFLCSVLTSLSVLSTAPTLAKEAATMAEDPVLEARVLAIAEELRCLVCQNETIAASHAALAVDLRGQIRTKLNEGQTQQEIMAYMVARYGDFVLYRPPLKATTVLLWVGPFALLLVGAGALALQLRQRRRGQQPEPLNPDELLRARQLLARPGDDT